MRIINKDVVVVGGGAAGLAAAVKARDEGIEDIVILEWGDELGGILPQCVHPGFGLDYFKEDLTGPEYIQRFIDKIEGYGIEAITNCMVTQLESRSHFEKRVVACGPEMGMVEIRSKAVIITTGCRERARYNLNIPGDRPSGVLTAGTAQYFMDIKGLMPGKNVVVLGSGDVGMIMARRFAQEGANVKGVYEIMSYPGGLKRNVVQCLEDYNIPLHLSTTVVRINGKRRLESVTVAKVDENLNPVPGTEEEVECDTLILSVGLIPDTRLPRILPEGIGMEMDKGTGGPVVNELLETSLPLVFAAGNFLMVNDLVDDVTAQGEIAGKSAADAMRNGHPSKVEWKPAVPSEGMRFVVPHKVSGMRDVKLYMRVNKPMENVYVEVPEIGKKFFARIARPPEMVKINLGAEEIKRAERLTFRVKRPSWLLEGIRGRE
ncbi:MAG: FAD-dependent oxidoreductase [Actinomycetota bacterium]|nr:FAD-dependent oxidoreductase [Actinomycetota bacterium]